MNKETKTKLLRFLRAASKLETKEKELELLTSQFKAMSSEITRLTGYELWHTDIGNEERYFWRTTALPKRDSKQYSSRETAIEVLIDDEIEWMDW